MHLECMITPIKANLCMTVNPAYNLKKYKTVMYRRKLLTICIWRCLKKLWLDEKFTLLVAVAVGVFVDWSTSFVACIPRYSLSSSGLCMRKVCVKCQPNPFRYFCEKLKRQWKSNNLFIIMLLCVILCMPKIPSCLFICALTYQSFSWNFILI